MAKLSKKWKFFKSSLSDKGQWIMTLLLMLIILNIAIDVVDLIQKAVDLQILIAMEYT